jgi:hypothetical protein
VYGLRQTYDRLGKRIEHTRWNYLVMWVMWKLVLVRLEIVITLTQDMCTVCVEHTRGSKIILELLGVGAHVESCLSPFGDRFSVGAR